MSDTDDRADRDRPDDAGVPGEAAADPAYAAGAGFSGEATGATPPEAGSTEGGADATPEPTAGPDPLGSTQPDPARPDVGGGNASPTGATPAHSNAGVSGGGVDDEAKTMALIAYIANIIGVFTGGLGCLAALILAFVKKDTSPEWIRTHFILTIRTVLIAFVACVIWTVLLIPLSLLSITGVPFAILIPILGIAIAAWVIGRSVVGLMKLNRNEAYPNPETWLI